MRPTSLNPRLNWLLATGYALAVAVGPGLHLGHQCGGEMYAACTHHDAAGHADHERSPNDGDRHDPGDCSICQALAQAPLAATIAEIGLSQSAAGEAVVPTCERPPVASVRVFDSRGPPPAA